MCFLPPGERTKGCHLEDSMSTQPGKSQSSSTTSLSLLARVKDNDAGAWQRLVNLYSPLVYYWCRESGLRDADSADLVQEVFRSVFCGLGSFRRDQPNQSFRGWLRTITRSRLHDHFRKNHRNVVAVGGSTGQLRIAEIPDHFCEDCGGMAEADETAMILHSALDLIRGEFEVRTWRIFWAVTVDLRYPAAVAEEFNVSTGAIYTAKSRILKRLREEVEDLLD